MTLPGGLVSTVTRIGNTVRRTPAPEFVHQVLDYLGQIGWPGAPRLLGIDSAGREILTFLDGEVPWQSPIRTDESLAAAARLVRELHDLTAGTPLAGDQEVLCHNDLSHRNTVYRDGIPFAFIDWDLAAPGARIHDVAHMSWQFLDLGPSVADIAEASRRLRLICDAYGLDDRTRLIETILWWQDRCRRGIEADPALEKLRAAGAIEAIRAAQHWVSAHQSALASAL